MSIKVIYKDGRVFEALSLLGIATIGSFTIVQCKEIFGGTDTKMFENDEIKKIEIIMEIK